LSISAISIFDQLMPATLSCVAFSPEESRWIRPHETSTYARTLFSDRIVSVEGAHDSENLNIRSTNNNQSIILS